MWVRVSKVLSPGWVVALASSGLLIIGQISITQLSLSGFDITDESSYLNSIKWANHYKYNVTSYGQFYALFFDLLGERWDLLRTANSWAMWALAAIFGYLLLERIQTIWSWEATLSSRVLLSIVFGSLSGFALNWWLPTPNYNSLAWQGILIFACGLLVFSKIGHWSSLILGLGLATTFIAKPTSAAALVLILLIVHTPKTKPLLALFASSGLVSFLALTVWATLIDGSLVQYVNRLAVGLEFVRLLDGDHIPRLQDTGPVLAVTLDPLIYLNQAGIIGLGSTVFFLTLIMILSRYLGDHWYFLILFWLAVLGLGFVFSYTVQAQAGGPMGQLVYVIPASTILFGVWASIMLRISGTKAAGPESGAKENTKLAIGLFLLPVAFAFGTNNNYWRLGSFLGIFLIAAAVLGAQLMISRLGLGEKASKQILLIQLLSGLLVLVASLGLVAQSPYRQSASVFDMIPSSVISGISTTSEIELYLSQVKSAALDNGFVPGTPLIDNSSHPGAGFAMEALPLGSPWVIGGHRGSADLARAQFALYSPGCLSRAWVLDEPEGPRRVLDFSTEGFEVSPSTKYQQVAVFYNPLRQTEQVLYKPISGQSNSVKTICIQMRK